MTPARLFVCALLAPALATASHESSIDTRVLPSQRAYLDRGADLISQGDVAQGTAYLDLAQTRVTLKLGLDCGPTGCTAATQKSIEDAAAQWREGGADVTVVPLAEANVRIHVRPQVGTGNHLAGHANWVKRVVQTGYQRYQARVSADVSLALTDTRGRALSPEAVTYVAAHEIGHVLGLDDTPRTGELMGPNQVDHPVAGPAPTELRALANLRDQAELLARVALR